MIVTPLGGKITAALVLLTLTFISTLLPYKLNRINSNERCIKKVSCFCGGLFVGLCFLHLIPDALKEFYSVPQLRDVQKVYPLAEFIMCLGMIVVMVAEKLTTAIQNRNEVTKCNNSKDCCKDNCKKQASNSLYGSLNKSYTNTPNETPVSATTLSTFKAEIDTNTTPGGGGDEVLIFNKSGERDVLVQQRGKNDATNNQNLTSSSSSLSVQMFNNKDTKTKVIKTICLIIALMIHSLFEGLTVGLQKSTYGIIALVAVLAFHKSIIGFSLGIAIVNTNRGIRFHMKQAVMFALASPFGIMAGTMLLSTKFQLFNLTALAVLICLATGTFLYITFFEILAKNLSGAQSQDMVAFVYFIIGFGIFASLTAIPGMQE